MTRGLLCAVAVLAGCGGAQVDSTEFSQRGNAICSATAARLARLARPAGMRTQVAAAGGWADAYAAETRAELSRLRALGSPPGVARTLRRVYADIERAVRRGQADPLRFRPGRLRGLFARLRAFGLDRCGP